MIPCVVCVFLCVCWGGWCCLRGVRACADMSEEEAQNIMKQNEQYRRTIEMMKAQHDR